MDTFNNNNNARLIVLLSMNTLSLLFIGQSLLIVAVNCDPHHPHIYHPGNPATNMTSLCQRHKWFLEAGHKRHLIELKYRTCMSQISLDKFKRREQECLAAMDPKDIGYCLAPESYQNKFEKLQQCLLETVPSEAEIQPLKECMGFPKSKGEKTRRRKRGFDWLTLRVANLSQLCDISMVNYYLNHPSHHEAHHRCTIETIGNERVSKRAACFSSYPIKNFDDFRTKCESPENFKAEFDTANECFSQNKITPEESESIMKCTFVALKLLDQDYALQALVYKPFDTFEEFCIKSRNYWDDDEEIYKDRFEACSMKINPVKTEARLACETFDKFDQTSIEKCIDKQEDEFNKMVACLGNHGYTAEEEEKIKVCLTDSQIKWEGVPKVSKDIAELCAYSLFRWFGFTPIYYKFVNECMKEKWTPEQYSNFECANILTIKTNEELEDACKNPSEDQKQAYLKFRECREKNEAPLEKIQEAFECSMTKMIEHVVDLKKSEMEAVAA